MLTENVPVARNRSVWRTTFRRDPQTIHLPDVNLAAVVAPKNVAALAIIVVVADVLDMPIVADRSVDDGAFGFDLQAIHLPDVDLSAVVAPENVALPIAVEVAEALDVPVVGDWRVRHAAFVFDSQAIHLPEIDLPAVVPPEHVVVAVAVEVAGALNVPVSGNWSVRHAAFGFDPQAIHLPEIDLPAVVAPENATLAVAVEIVDRVHVCKGDEENVEGVVQVRERNSAEIGRVASQHHGVAVRPKARGNTCTICGSPAGGRGHEPDAAIQRIVEERIVGAVGVARSKVRSEAVEQHVTAVLRERLNNSRTPTVARGCGRACRMAHQIDAGVLGVIEEEVKAGVAVVCDKVRGIAFEQHITAIRREDRASAERCAAPRGRGRAGYVAHQVDAAVLRIVEKQIRGAIRVGDGTKVGGSAVEQHVPAIGREACDTDGARIACRSGGRTPRMAHQSGLARCEGELGLYAEEE